MPTETSAAPFVPERGGLRALAKAAAQCRGCDLYQHATQTVFGAGPTRAELVLVDEQPGDIEDRQGVPFVGPAGRVLDRALAEAGLVRDRVYLTNAVKHFRSKVAARGNAAFTKRLRPGTSPHAGRGCRLSSLLSGLMAWWRWELSPPTHCAVMPSV